MSAPESAGKDTQTSTSPSQSGKQQVKGKTASPSTIMNLASLTEKNPSLTTSTTEPSRQAIAIPEPEPVPLPPPSPVSAPRECFLDGSEQQYELLIGVRHGVPRPRRMWPGSAGLATHYICDECWRRLGHNIAE